jgi:hypothetical protein
VVDWSEVLGVGEIATDAKKTHHASRFSVGFWV